MRAPIYRFVATSLAWTGVKVGSTMISPDTDEDIDIRGAKDIIVQVSTKAAANDSDDLDMNVLTSMEETTNYDNLPYTEENIGDASVKTFHVLSGPAYMRLRCDNNHGSGTGHVTAHVRMRV